MSDPKPKSSRPSTSDPSQGRSSENVRVVVRCRPLSRKEADRDCKQIVEVDTNKNCITISNPNPASAEDPSKTFTFDSVFPPESTQADVYNDVARPIVENVLEGYNGTIFAYGQTGTGKTFTMEGVYKVPELKGIIPNSFAQIFSHIAKAEGDQRFLVRCSYLEIYNEDVRDLLSTKSTQKLEVKENKDKGVYVKGLTSYVVRNENDMDTIMNTGNQNRSVASTNMNSVSSRSHAIFTITVECSMEHKYQSSSESSVKKDGGRSIRVGKLNLVDLAGSERLSKTGATGDRLKEATKINLSLSNLGNVISALVEGSSHVPYRNSKLTRLLQDSLGGNSKTVMVANVGPADYNYDETVSTLRFANRAKNIRNHAVINEDPKDALLRQYESEIQALKQQLMEEIAQLTAEQALMVRPAGEEGEVVDDFEDLDEGMDGLKIGEGSIPNEEALLDIKDELENHAKLSSTIGNESQEKVSVISALKEKVLTWKQTEEQKLKLQHRLKSLNQKILVGGENLLEKSQAQEELLLRSMREISERKEEEKKLQQHLSQQEEERSALDSKILACEEQNMAVSRKLKKVWHSYQQQKNELNQVQLEYKEEIDALVDDVHRLSRELQFHNTLIDNFIPPNYQRLIEKSIKWQNDGAEWSLKCIAYAGNNMTRSTSSSTAKNSKTSISQGHNHHHKSDVQSVDLSNFYLDVGDDFEFQDQEDSSPVAGKLMGQQRMGVTSSSSKDIGKDRGMVVPSRSSSRPSTTARGFSQSHQQQRVRPTTASSRTSRHSRTMMRDFD
jgi:kinesin family protein 3/17